MFYFAQWVSRMLNYQEYTPSPDLQPFIDCYWQVWHDPQSEWNVNRPLLLDGCTDLLFGLAGQIQYERSTHQHTFKTIGTLLGPQTKPYRMKPLGRIHLFVIRFKPGVIYPLFGISGRQLTNNAIPFADIFYNDANSLEEVLWDTYQRKNIRVTNFISIVEHALRSHVRRINPESLVNRAVLLLFQNHGVLPINEVCERTNTSRQHLARLFHDHVGMSPKLLARVFRFRHALEQLEKDDFSDWPTFAIDAGYYDQSHLIADFTEFTGFSPKQYVDKNYHKFHFSNTTA